MYSENAMFPISERKVNWHLDRFINPSSIALDDSGVRGFIGVIGEMGKLEGAIAIALWQPWYSDAWALDEYLNFVDPDHRSSNHSRALIGYAKNIIDQLLPTNPNITLVIGVLSTRRTMAKLRHYSQMLQPCGAYFRYPPMDGTMTEPLKKIYRTN